MASRGVAVSDLQLSPEGLRSHAAHLGQVVDITDKASNTCGQVSISDWALGMMVGPLVVAPLSLVEACAKSAIASSSEAVDHMATQLQQVAADFERSESETKGSFDETGACLSSGWPVANAGPSSASSHQVASGLTWLI